MHQELAGKTDAKYSPEAFLLLYPKKQGVVTFPKGVSSSLPEKQGVTLGQSVISHLEAKFCRNTAFLV